MREFNLLENYPKPKNPRLVNSKLRTIENRILASYRDINLYMYFSFYRFMYGM